MWSALRKQNVQCEKVYFSGKSRGGARPPPLFLDQTEARKNVFRPPPALSQGLDHPPPPPPRPVT